MAEARTPQDSATLDALPQVFHRSVFENAPFGICVCGPHPAFAILRVNPAFCRLLDYEQQELVGRLSLTDLSHAGDRASWGCMVEKMVGREIRQFAAETRYLAKSGRVIDAIAFTNAVYEDDGSYAGSTTTVMDITERKKADDALRLAEFSIEHSCLSTIWFDRASRVIRVNEATCQALGYTRQELSTMRVRDFDPNFQTDQSWDEIWNRIESIGHYVVIETLHRRKDGRVFPVEVASSYLQYAGQGYVFSFIRDITDRKNAERDREQLHAQLLQAQKMESVGRLAGGVAHDFNNMLQLILGYTDVLLDSITVDGPLYPSVMEIRKAGLRSADLTRELLAFARRQPVSPKVVDLNELCSGMLRMLQRLIGEGCGSFEAALQAAAWV